MIHILPKFLVFSTKAILQRCKVEVKSGRVEIYRRIPLATTPLQVVSLQEYFNCSCFAAIFVEGLPCYQR